MTLWDIALIAQKQNDTEKYFNNVGESYEILKQLGDAGGLSIIGKTYGQLLCEKGDTEYGLEVLKLSQYAYTIMGKVQDAQQVEQMIEAFFTV
ncbi:MAG: hypothetical protein GY795_47475 [Desulfobacterales bacterium]|nr:hypothetical protein [Desulfobacterales bacterium]